MVYLLADCPAEMEDLMAAMHAANAAYVQYLAERTPADAVVSVENTSTTLISPAQFERYCWPHLRDYGRAIEAAGKMHELHMCGHTRALLPRIDALPAASIEAFTSPTLGNTRLVDGRTMAPTKTLVGGTNVNVWLWPVDKIKEYVLGELAACPDHRRIVLTTAGVAPPACRAETFRAIGQWLPTVPVRM
jgi:uroporphyrinogen-III decarboxylase